MDPVLLWVVSSLSALLLVVSGALVARAALAARVLRLRRRAVEIRAAFDELETRYQSLLATYQEARVALDRARQPEGASRGTGGDPEGFSEAASLEGGFGEATLLPDPVDFFRQVQAAEAAPGLDRVAHDEYEIRDAASQGILEGAESGSEEELAPQDSTRQFNLHSPEAAVHFLQRIDELNDENRDLRATLEQRDEVIQGQRAERGEQVQRLAALDATVSKLRQELKRRSERIGQLEVRLQEALQRDLAISKAAPRSVVQELSTQSARGSSSSQTLLDEPTLQVPRLSERDLASYKK